MGRRPGLVIITCLFVNSALPSLLRSVLTCLLPMSVRLHVCTLGHQDIAE